MLFMHLSLIRDVVHAGHNAGSFAELCTRLAECIVTGLGYEHVVVVTGRDGEPLVVSGDYSQAERFGEGRRPPPAVLLDLAHDVMVARALSRWGGDGVGSRRPLPPGIDGAIVGFPLTVGGECVGAVLCVRLSPGSWDLVSQRALELAAEIIDQVATLAQVRLTMAEVQRGLESELGDSRNRLVRQEATLREQSKRIGELAGSLIRSSRAKNTFLALMSHELRTPLSVIIGFGSILCDGMAGPVTPQQQEYIERIYNNARHLHQLVEDMLFFVEAESARITAVRAEVDLGQLVREVVSALPMARTTDGPELVVTIAPEAAVIRSDPGLLRRVLFHLLGNAFKFTERGEVRVEVARAVGGRATELRIVDTGIGIAPDQLGRIFELFRQGDERHSRKHDGIGLGLSLVRACLGLLKGRCRILPGTRGGTRVEITLPDADGASDGRLDGLNGIATVRPCSFGESRLSEAVSRTVAPVAPTGRAGTANR